MSFQGHFLAEESICFAHEEWNSSISYQYRNEVCGVLIQIIMITFIAGVIGTGAGGIMGVLLCRDSVKITGLLVSFAAGIMLSVVCFSMIHDAVLPANASRQMNILLVNTGIMLGFLMVWMFNLWIQKIGSDRFKVYGSMERNGLQDSMGSGVMEDSVELHLLTAGIVMILAISIHNLPEGMVIGASYAADAVGNGKAGLLLAIVIGVHNIPEGMAVAVALVNGGVSRIKTMILTAGSGIPVVVGAYIGWELGTMGPVMLCLMLSFAAGAMLYVVMGELIPEALELWQSKITAVSILVGMLTGMIIIFA